MDFTREQVEKVAQFAGVSREEAWVALEQAGGSPLDAVLLLEKRGRANPVPGGIWSTRLGAAPEEQGRVSEPLAVRQRPRRKYTAREVGDAARNLLRNCTKITVDIWRGDDLLAGIPLFICVVLFIVGYKVMIPLALVGLVLRCRYHISGWEGNADDINRTMDEVTDTVSGWTDRVRQEFRSYQNRKK